MNENNITTLNFWFHLTDNCNLNCDYCYISTLETKKNMSRLVIFQFIDKLIETLTMYPLIQNVTIKLAGGEPLSTFNQWKNLIKILIAKIEEKNIFLKLRILTNLTIVNMKMIEFFKKYNIILGISLDGLENYHNQYRKFKNGNGSFSTVQANILKLQQEDIPFAILVTISNNNMDGIIELVKFLLKNNITFRLADAKGVFNDRVKLQTILDSCHALMDNYIEKGFSPKYKYVLCDLNMITSSNTPCSMGVNSCAIYIDGSIYFCHSQFGTNNPLGSIFDNDNIVSILQKGMKFHSLSEECNLCEFRTICAGGCPLYRTEANKSPMCSIFKSSIPKIQKMIQRDIKINL